MAWKSQVYTIGPDCNLGSPFVLICRAKQREVLCPSVFVAASAPDPSLVLQQASHSLPAKSLSFFLADIQESPAPSVGRKV